MVGSIYESLGVPGFGELRPRLESDLASIAGYGRIDWTTCASRYDVASHTNGPGASTSGRTCGERPNVVPPAHS